MTQWQITSKSIQYSETGKMQTQSQLQAYEAMYGQWI
jgi:hypothetical protein